MLIIDISWEFNEYVQKFNLFFKVENLGFFAVLSGYGVRFNNLIS